MVKVTKTKSYCNPPGCRCPVIEVLSESKTKEVVAVHIRESEVSGVKLVLDYCEADFSSTEKILSALRSFITSIDAHTESIATDVADLAKTEA